MAARTSSRLLIIIFAPFICNYRMRFIRNALLILIRYNESILDHTTYSTTWNVFSLDYTILLIYLTRGACLDKVLKDGNHQNNSKHVHVHTQNKENSPCTISNFEFDIKLNVTFVLAKHRWNDKTGRKHSDLSW